MTLSIPDFSRVKVLVAGDLMLDRYWSGDTARISPEAPVPVVRVGERLERPGGAGNVALNIAALGAGAQVAGVIGDDEAGAALERLLNVMSGISCRLSRQADVATITKLRVLSRHQQLLRLDFEQPKPSPQLALAPEDLATALSEADIVLLSDYAKGTLGRVQELIKVAADAGKAVLVDPKLREFSAYRGAAVLTPNMAEFEAAVGACTSDADLIEKAHALLQTEDIGALVITRSEKGMLVLERGQQPVHIPAQAREVFDVTGAGDTVIAVLAASLGAGVPLADAARLANAAAGIVVGKLGAATVNVPELRRALFAAEGPGQGVLSEDALLLRIEDARAHGESIVMTNGCFDILHAGHVTYLEQARRLGDRLIVAVNDDDSVGRLKGPTRPVVPLEHRMTVLAGLAAVDWVVPFSEDTPARLIGRVKPDILVKGGDYRPDEVAGHEHAARVEIVELMDGCSTSTIIDTIRTHHDQK
jgi:D-beta-D-heptose 7-phosphate kinase/D-beta-D-heptose 1-phosphate adenosyltransferase